ncbi:MAG: outer membrane lipoprotein-sorting protein [Candidatus Muiribacterium halophilum]|uniref:Outer membrane lipoprotein-sorting protein n=1 Tax=Muiribacterium halophilum TaxID=2053465 RepID=A0A2N5ZLA0_MUIH1|nr:MAG: outer membrane lipoprotein-sorting protein [Candidatus Muirbacterium halophilum]
MKKVFFLLSIVLLCTTVIFSNELTVEEILDAVDENQTPESITHDGEMIIHRGNRTIEKKFELKAEGKERSFMEFTYPPRDKGTKYLRVDDNLWMYLPGAERTVKISGHMLRQSMMGSDFSYDDQTENRKINDQYKSTILGSTTLDSNEVWIIDLIARDGIDVPYYRQKCWIDKKKLVIHKAELYGRSGKMLKMMYMSEFKDISGKYYPHKIVMEDVIKKGHYTEVIVKDVKLDVKIPEKVFSLRYLERK